MDNLQRFFFAQSGIRGHWVDLRDSLAELDSRRAYPAPLLALLGEMMAVVAMIADGSKWPGNLVLQAKPQPSDPTPLNLAMAEFRPGGKLRAIAQLREESPHSLPSPVLAQGQLTLSLLPGESAAQNPNLQPYQGIVELAHGKLGTEPG